MRLTTSQSDLEQQAAQMDAGQYWQAEPKPLPPSASANTLEPPIVAAAVVPPSALTRFQTDVTTGHAPSGDDTGNSVTENFVVDNSVEANADSLRESDSPPGHSRQRLRWWQWPLIALGFTWNVASLVVLLAFVAAIPVVQLISLGYMLRATANLSSGGPWRSAFPGLQLAGRLLTYFLLAALLWLPVWLMTDVSYSVQLMLPDSRQAAGWRAAAFAVAFLWLAWIGWAAMRGGRWWHMLWPAPIRFIRTAWRPSTWSRAADELLELTSRMQLLRLWWLGARAAVGALVWLAIPASMMIIGLRAHELKIAPLVGLIGAVGLTCVMMYLPYLQILVAERNRFLDIFNVREVRRRFRLAPLAHAIALLLLLALSVPLYLLRIEATPEELTWLPSLLFVGLMFPARILTGAACGYGARRTQPRNFVLRWSARSLAFAASLTYVGTLYIAQFVAWQGIYVMYFQHVVLVPVAS